MKIGSNSHTRGINYKQREGQSYDLLCGLSKLSSRRKKIKFMSKNDEVRFAITHGSTMYICHNHYILAAS
jgi:hypothetical protein